MINCQYKTGNLFSINVKIGKLFSTPIHELPQIFFFLLIHELQQRKKQIETYTT